MDERAVELLRYLFSEFDMEDGEWPGTHVFSTAYGRVWGTFSDSVAHALQELHSLVEEADND